MNRCYTTHLYTLHHIVSLIQVLKIQTTYIIMPNISTVEFAPMPISSTMSSRFNPNQTEIYVVQQYMKSRKSRPKIGRGEVVEVLIPVSGGVRL